MSTPAEQRKLVKRACQKYRASPWTPITQLQRETSRDPPARGGVWISRTVFPAPANPSIRDALYRVIDHLRKDYHRITPPEETPIQDVGVEFIGSLPENNKNASEPDIEEEKLRVLLKECDSDMTILYIHGGGLYFGSPAQYRAASARLSKMTKAPVASIKHRLAPSHTFPAPILDALVAYVSLLYPPAGAPYRPVPANKIILAGNSSGTNLCFGLTKVLLELQKLPRSDASIDFHRRRVTLPLPAGIATVGGWCDQCDALPSWHRNGEYDCLGVLQPPCMPGFPTDSVWPANPPREHPYCVAATLDHELVTPAAVGDWTGAPPMLLLCGCEEAGVDGNRVVASQAAKSGVSVLWNEYEGMPHEFPLIMSSLPQAKHAFELWARTCKDFAESKPVRSSAVRWLMPDCGKEDLGDPRNLSPLPFTEVRRRMREYNATRSVWTGKLGQPRL